jgi:pimeloyl-ACP methyl ester carboxylesterase
VLMGATNVAAATPGAVMMRDSIVNGSQEDYAQGEKEFLHSLVKSPEGYKAATGWAIASDKSVVGRAMYEVMTTDLRPKLREIKAPVTMLYPWDASAGVTQAMVNNLYKQSFAALTNKTMVRIDGSYHFIMLDQPEGFAKQVEMFLK